MSADKAINVDVPINFYIDGVQTEYLFHEMTIKESSNFRAKLKSAAREDWRDRVRDMAGIITDAKERNKFLVEIASQEPDWEVDMARIAHTSKGIMWAIQTGCKQKLDQDLFDKLDEDARNTDNILYAIRVVMGIKVAQATEATPDTVVADPL